MHITALLSYNSHEYTDIIKFSDHIMIYMERNKDRHTLCYRSEQCNKIGSYDIMNNISENATVAQFMDFLGSLNHAVSTVGEWIFDSNYKRAVPLSTEYLYLICSCSEK